MNNVFNENTDYISPVNAKSYIFGFILSVVLTNIPFWMVISHSTSHYVMLGIIVSCAIIQILVHLFCFLHLDSKSENGWNMISLVFSALIILIIVTGSIWIMSNLNYNMMPN
ncbi:cytochrome o ubiquinol oxidase subunit IV [Candidatus Pantoea edessiphila]|uniref:Cytochrome bo(3) ubiquinol oxidase subunit 4 n=1 Tax=Candidatus Pantoea edessiphila TaxID=2044610 RepID=A0A2P5SXJ5_9GAMM|nr:cytochrome o ubiquinol oxidase subunit IV [Candidatus Pantoea edessiphila]MBK4775794.1 cytochrome o ubiquinol oxidase subunit IV [Pantoea sp. Edef]PPI87022.1 cytochrome o ubiquinol oxidase subunit IV [Candidatus Pantoea edessiphila]